MGPEEKQEEQVQEESTRERRRSSATANGTLQSIKDGGCVDHDPELYAHSSLAESAGLRLPAVVTTTTTTASSGALLRQYHEDGFLVFSQAFSQRHANAMGEALDRLTTGTNATFALAFRTIAAACASSKEGMPDFSSGQKIPWVQYEAGTVVENEIQALTPEISDRVRKLMGFVGYEKDIDAVVTNEGLLTLVAYLLDCQVEQLELFQDMALLKPAGGGREKPWHQDKAYFNVSLDIQVVGCWIAVDEATCDNGCLRMLRGGHKAGPMMHFSERDYQICDSAAPSMASGDDVVAVPLPAGGLVLFDGMIPHGTPTNKTSQQRRRALQFHWIKRGAETVGPDEPGGRAAVFGGAANKLSC